MSFQAVAKLPSPEEVLSLVPLNKELKKIKIQRDREIKDIIAGKSSKILLIIGPCSAHEETSVLDYVKRISMVQERVKDKIIIVPRVYTNKPRTTGVGYKGMLHQPVPDEKSDILLGLLAIRKLHLNVFEETGLSTADEMLYPDNTPYLEDILSYVAVGARSTENQQHRLVASGMDIPVGMKNPTSGDLSIMLNSVSAAQSKHDFIYCGNEVYSSSNEYAHVILRGAQNKHGESIPNYHYEDLELAVKLYGARGFKNPMIVVDVNHDNSKKKHYHQPRIVNDVLTSREWNPKIRSMVRGFMVESFIEAGRQEVEEGIYGKSITDPCIGWEDTEALIHYIAENA